MLVNFFLKNIHKIDQETCYVKTFSEISHNYNGDYLKFTLI